MRVCKLFVGLMLFCQIGFAQSPEIFQVARHGTPDDISMVATNGADINATDEYGQTPLMYAAGGNSNPRAIRVLIELGAKVNARSGASWTALMYAARDTTNASVVLALLEAGADANIRNSEHNTALHYAANNPALVGTVALTELAKRTGEELLIDTQSNIYIGSEAINSQEEFTEADIVLLERAFGTIALRIDECTEGTEYWFRPDIGASGSFTGAGISQTILTFTARRCDRMEGQDIRKVMLVHDGEAIIASIENPPQLRGIVDLNFDGVDELLVSGSDFGQGYSSTTVRLVRIDDGSLTTLHDFGVLSESSCDAFPDGIGTVQTARVTYSASVSGQLPSFNILKGGSGCDGEPYEVAREKEQAFLDTMHGSSETGTSPTSVYDAAATLDLTEREISLLTNIATQGALESFATFLDFMMQVTPMHEVNCPLIAQAMAQDANIPLAGCLAGNFSTYSELVERWDWEAAYIVEGFNRTGVIEVRVKTSRFNDSESRVYTFIGSSIVVVSVVLAPDNDDYDVVLLVNY